MLHELGLRDRLEETHVLSQHDNLPAKLNGLLDIDTLSTRKDDAIRVEPRRATQRVPVPGLEQDEAPLKLGEARWFTAAH